MTDPLPLLLVAVFTLTYPWWITSGYANTIRRTLINTGLRKRKRTPRWQRRLIHITRLYCCWGNWTHQGPRFVSFRHRPDWEHSLEVDHRHPWSEGGSNSIWNKDALCRECNQTKGARIEEAAW